MTSGWEARARDSQIRRRRDKNESRGRRIRKGTEATIWENRPLRHNHKIFDVQMSKRWEAEGKDPEVQKESHKKIRRMMLRARRFKRQASAAALEVTKGS